MKICKWLACGFLAIALPAIADDAPAKCKLVRLADWHVRLLGTHPILDGYVNGKRIGVLIDTGAYASILTKSAAERLGLPTRSTGQTVLGIAGNESRSMITRMEDFKIGDFSAKGLRVLVAGEMPMAGIDFILGQDVLSTVDIEFDYANSAVRLYQTIDCKGKFLAYWDADAQQLPLSGDRHDLIPVVVNGRSAQAMIDSGGGASMVQRAFAENLGLTATSPGVQSAACTYGIGDGMVHQWVAKFDSIALGAETIRNPRVRIGELNSDFAYYRTSGPDMMLGGDFLRTHHLLISHSQGKVYFSYTRGQVFPATPALDCDDDRVRGMKPKQALAVYDEVLAKNPADVKTLLHRANLRLAQNDLKGALADLDAAIGIEPTNPVALSLRTRTRGLLKDYAGALADSDAAIENGMRTSYMYTYRAWLRRAAGDTAGMLAEFDEALKLDPRDVYALRTRGRYFYFQDNLPGAENDFRSVLALRANGFDSIWLYLTRVRQGDGKLDPLEEGMAQLKKDDWPAPVMQYMADRIDRDALMKAASVDEKQRKGRECEAHFYMAERFLAAGKKDEARPLLEAARDGCPNAFIEYESAIAELDRFK